MTKTDLQLKNDVEAELRWDSKINGVELGAVRYQAGVVGVTNFIELTSAARQWRRDGR